ncbi:MAG: hypothetical protein ACP5VE_15250 [Chthonomonadales bacterium]
MNRRRWTAVAVGAVLVSTLTLAAAGQLGSILKGGAVIFAVDKFGPDINKFINGLEGQHNARGQEATKVVPILSIGDGGYAGAVQVSGPAEQVRKVQGVAQIEGRFKLVGGVRVRALIPISTRNPQNGIRRVNGVGVSAIVDIRL